MRTKSVKSAKVSARLAEMLREFKLEGRKISAVTTFKLEDGRLTRTRIELNEEGQTKPT